MWSGIIFVYTQISSGKAETTYGKLANDTDREEQDNRRVALLFWNYSYISHSCNYKPCTRESGNRWRVISYWEFQQVPVLTAYFVVNARVV